MAVTKKMLLHRKIRYNSNKIIFVTPLYYVILSTNASGIYAFCQKRQSGNKKIPDLHPVGEYFCRLILACIS